jgi:hypothetical protein
MFAACHSRLQLATILVCVLCVVLYPVVLRSKMPGNHCQN